MQSKIQLAFWLAMVSLCLTIQTLSWPSRIIRKKRRQKKWERFQKEKDNCFTCKQGQGRKSNQWTWEWKPISKLAVWWVFFTSNINSFPKTLPWQIMLAQGGSAAWRLWCKILLQFPHTPVMTNMIVLMAPWTGELQLSKLLLISYADVWNNNWSQRLQFNGRSGWMGGGCMIVFALFLIFGSTWRINNNIK